MQQNVKEKLAASALTLLEPFHPVSGCVLRRVSVRRSHDDVSAFYFHFDAASLVVEVDPGDDTVDVTLVTSYPDDLEDVTHLQPWKTYAKNEFACGWIGINQQGYVDTISLSFEGAVPDVAITALASSLQITGQVNQSMALHRDQVAA